MKKEESRSIEVFFVCFLEVIIYFISKHIIDCAFECDYISAILSAILLLKKFSMISSFKRMWNLYNLFET